MLRLYLRPQYHAVKEIILLLQLFEPPVQQGTECPPHWLWVMGPDSIQYMSVCPGEGGEHVSTD